MQVRDELLANKEITREELKAMVDEWVADGGKIKQIKPHDAYSFGPALLPPPKGPGMPQEAKGHGMSWKQGSVSLRKSLNTWVTNGPKKKAKTKAK